MESSHIEPGYPKIIDVDEKGEKITFQCQTCGYTEQFNLEMGPPSYDWHCHCKPEGMFMKREDILKARDRWLSEHNS